MASQGRATRGGFREAQAKYGFAEQRAFIGDVRRFGPFGPAYEVVDVKANGDVRIVVVETGERLDYAQAEYLADPVAETVP